MMLLAILLLAISSPNVQYGLSALPAGCNTSALSMPHGGAPIETQSFDAATKTAVASVIAGASERQGIVWPTPTRPSIPLDGGLPPAPLGWGGAVASARGSVAGFAPRMWSSRMGTAVDWIPTMGGWSNNPMPYGLNDSRRMGNAWPTWGRTAADGYWLTSGPKRNSEVVNAIRNSIPAGYIAGDGLNPLKDAPCALTNTNDRAVTLTNAMETVMSCPMDAITNRVYAATSSQSRRRLSWQGIGALASAEALCDITYSVLPDQVCASQRWMSVVRTASESATVAATNIWLSATSYDARVLGEIPAWSGLAENTVTSSTWAVGHPREAIANPTATVRYGGSGGSHTPPADGAVLSYESLSNLVWRSTVLLAGVGGMSAGDWIIHAHGEQDIGGPYQAPSLRLRIDSVTDPQGHSYATNSTAWFWPQLAAECSTEYVTNATIYAQRTIAKSSYGVTTAERGNPEAVNLIDAPGVPASNLPTSNSLWGSLSSTQLISLMSCAATTNFSPSVVITNSPAAPLFAWDIRAGGTSEASLRSALAGLSGTAADGAKLLFASAIGGDVLSETSARSQMTAEDEAYLSSVGADLWNERWQWGITSALGADVVLVASWSNGSGYYPADLSNVVPQSGVTHDPETGGLYCGQVLLYNVSTDEHSVTFPYGEYCAEGYTASACTWTWMLGNCQP